MYVEIDVKFIRENNDLLCHTKSCRLMLELSREDHNFGKCQSSKNLDYWTDRLSAYWRM